MADLMDVQDALKRVVTEVLYPAGPAQASVTGRTVVIETLQPLQAQLEADLATGCSHVFISSLENERKTTRFVDHWRTLKHADITVKATVSGRSVTLSGSTQTAHNLLLLADGVAKSVAVPAGSRLESCAAALAAQFPASTVSGTTLTFPPATRQLLARVGGFDTVIRELCRIEKEFVVSILADSPESKRALANLLMPVLVDTRVLTGMPDGSVPRMVYRRSLDSDIRQDHPLYRRDIVLTIEYAVTRQAQFAQVLSINESLFVGGDVSPTISKPF